jgi:hypothetical protein
MIATTEELSDVIEAFSESADTALCRIARDPRFWNHRHGASGALAIVGVLAGLRVGLAIGLAVQGGAAVRGA